MVRRAVGPAQAALRAERSRKAAVRARDGDILQPSSKNISGHATLAVPVRRGTKSAVRVLVLLVGAKLALTLGAAGLAASERPSPPLLLLLRGRGMQLR